MKVNEYRWKKPWFFIPSKEKGQVKEKENLVSGTKTDKQNKNTVNSQILKRLGIIIKGLKNK
jgi:hypothetical protein